MNSAEVQEAVKEYYIRRGHPRETIVDIRVKGGRQVKGAVGDDSEEPKNGTIELTITAIAVNSIEDDMNALKSYNSLETNTIHTQIEMDKMFDTASDVDSNNFEELDDYMGNRMITTDEGTKTFIALKDTIVNNKGAENQGQSSLFNKREDNNVE